MWDGIGILHLTGSTYSIGADLTFCLFIGDSRLTKQV